jgi:hypothetical protein
MGSGTSSPFTCWNWFLSAAACTVAPPQTADLDPTLYEEVLRSIEYFLPVDG